MNTTRLLTIVLLHVFFLMPAARAEVPVLGTVLDAASDLPVPRARFFGPDSAFLGASDATGRFELRLPRPFEVTVRREGFRDTTVALLEYSNLLDLTIAIEAVGAVLRGGVVTGRAGAARRHAEGMVEAIEAVAGMRFDLMEHLRVLHGVGGIREFSSEVSVYGSRSADVSHLLGDFQIPSLRHLDVSFPGSQSVLNPRVVERVRVEHDPTRGPLEQGLASAIQYVPRRAPTQGLELRGNLGITSQELTLATPAGPAGLVVSGRMLNPAVLRHLGDRFWAGSGGRTARTGDTARAVSDFDLEAYDGFGRATWGAGAWGVSATVLTAFDAHRFRLDATDEQGVHGLVTVSRGEQASLVAFAEASGTLASGDLRFWAGRSSVRRDRTLSDTLLRNPANAGAGEAAYQWAAFDETRIDDRLGVSFVPSFGGGRWEGLAAVHHRGLERAQGERRDNVGAIRSRRLDSLVVRNDLTWSRARASVRRRDSVGTGILGLSAGGLWAQEAGVGMEATASWSLPLYGVGWTLQASRRQDDRIRPLAFGETEVVRHVGNEVKVGWGVEAATRLQLTGAVYGRWLQDPALPEPDAWWSFPETRRARSATVGGATLQGDWRRFHGVQANVQVARVQGSYELDDGGSLPWESARDLEVTTFVKLHPRRDTLLAVFLTHVASLGKPMYRHLIDTSARSRRVEIDPQAERLPEVRDLFRTDLRGQLDLPSGLPPFRGFRFYVELQNAFAGFSGAWARALGARNYRQRSWSPVQATRDGHPVAIQPLHAEGTGMFVAFGVEATLAP